MVGLRAGKARLLQGMLHATHHAVPPLPEVANLIELTGTVPRLIELTGTVPLVLVLVAALHACACSRHPAQLHQC